MNVARKSRSDGSFLRWKRRKLWKRDSRCHWCRDVTLLIEDGSPKRKPVPNEATIDHLDPRHSPERGRHAGEIRQVLACWKCNGERNREFWQAKPIQEIWQHTGQFYSIAKRSGALNEVSP